MNNETTCGESRALALPEMERYAQAIVRSRFCGFDNADQVITLALVAQAEGRPIGSVARDYHVINGRPTLKADAMLARYQAAGGKVRWTALTDKECAATFSHPASGEFALCWTLEMAKNAGLTGKAVWRQFPRAMLRARVISEGIRTSFPAVLCGTYTPEEAMDMEPERPSRAPEPRPERPRFVPDEEPEPPKPAREAVEAEVVAPEPRTANPEDALPANAYGEFCRAMMRMRREEPEPYEAVKARVRANGWHRMSDVPPDRYEEVLAWKDEFIAEQAAARKSAADGGTETEN